jgi:hypothetical protein
VILEPVNAESKADLEDGEKETPRGHWARSFSLPLKASAARGGTVVAPPHSVKPRKSLRFACSANCV